MSRSWNCLVVAILVAMTSACNAGRHSSSGFRLPEYGNAERGKATFLALECNRCHQVVGANLPMPNLPPAVPIMLGGDKMSETADGYLVASIINPSYKVDGFPKELVRTADGKSRMPEYADNITVRQLTDLVSFLQVHYTYRPRTR